MESMETYGDYPGYAPPDLGSSQPDVADGESGDGDGDGTCIKVKIEISKTLRDLSDLELVKAFFSNGGGADGGFEPDGFTMLSSLDDEATRRGFDLTDVLAQPVSAAARNFKFNPSLHPRGHDGQFIKIGDLLSLFGEPNTRFEARGVLDNGDVVIHPHTMGDDTSWDRAVPSNSLVTIDVKGDLASNANGPNLDELRSRVHGDHSFPDLAPTPDKINNFTVEDNLAAYDSGALRTHDLSDDELASFHDQVQTEVDTPDPQANISPGLADTALAEIEDEQQQRANAGPSKQIQETIDAKFVLDTQARQAEAARVPAFDPKDFSAKARDAANVENTTLSPEEAGYIAEIIKAGHALPPPPLNPQDLDDVITRFADSPQSVDLTLLPQFDRSKSLGIPRVEMPQIDEQYLEEFQQRLQTAGHAVHFETTDPSNLTATQNELDGRQVGGMLGATRKGELDLVDNPIWTSQDDHILDGHHRWAVASAISQNCGGCIEIPILRVDMTMTDLLAFANAFNDEKGIKRKAFGQPDPRHPKVNAPSLPTPVPTAPVAVPASLRAAINPDSPPPPEGIPGTPESTAVSDLPTDSPSEQTFDPNDTTKKFTVLVPPPPPGPPYGMATDAADGITDADFDFPKPVPSSELPPMPESLKQKWSNPPSENPDQGNVQASISHLSDADLIRAWLGMDGFDADDGMVAAIEAETRKRGFDPADVRRSLG